MTGPEGAPVIGPAIQRHRIALLALLALSPGRCSTRDKLMGYLWPESDREHARQLLNQAVYHLRKALREEAILSAGDELRLNTDVIETDVLQFEAALAREDPASAAVLYGGPLLDGLFLSDSVEFERWVDRERDRLGAAYAGALEALAEAAEQGGEHARAAEWWRARAAYDPYDSRVALQLMRALQASGNQAGALQHASVHARMLEAEFGLAPPAEVAAFVERLRESGVPGIAGGAAPAGAGRQLSVSGQELPTAAAPLPHPRAAAPSHETDSTPTERPANVQTLAGMPEPARRRRLSRALFTLVLSVAIAWSFWPADPAPEGSIVVLPFANMTPHAGNEYLSDGLTEEIITRLAAVPDLKVISRTSAMHYKGTKAPLRQIANDLKVAHVLEGSVRQNEDELRITVQLIDAGTDAHLLAETYDFPPRDLFTVQERIAREILRALQLEPGEHGNRTLARRATGDTVAYEFYRRGRYFWAKRTREGHERAIAYYNEAIARDSSYAAPYAGLADAYLTQYQSDLSVEREAEVHARMKWAAERALALDDQSADAHASFAASLLWQRNWPGAEREFRRALELNPGNASARSWYALLMISMGRLEEARRESQRALELDPFSIITSTVVAQACYVARDYDCTIEEQRKTLELSDSWVPAYMGRGMAYSMAGMHDAAIRDLTKAVELAPRFAASISDFAYVLARAGRETEARDALRRAKLNPVPSAFRIGRAHAALGEADSAFAWLDRSRWQWAHIAVLSDPALDPVRADARFAQLTLRVEREMGVK